MQGNIVQPLLPPKNAAHLSHTLLWHCGSPEKTHTRSLSENSFPFWSPMVDLHTDILVECHTVSLRSVYGVQACVFVIAIYATQGNIVQSPLPSKNGKHLTRTLLQLSHSPNKNTRSLSDNTSASFLLSTHPKAHPSAHTPSPHGHPHAPSRMKRTISDPLPFLPDAHKNSNHDIRPKHDQNPHKSSLGNTESYPTPTPFLTNEHATGLTTTASQNRKKAPNSKFYNDSAVASKQLSIDIVPSTERVAGDRFLASPVAHDYGAPETEADTYDGRTEVTNVDLDEPTGGMWPTEWKIANACFLSLRFWYGQIGRRGFRYNLPIFYGQLLAILVNALGTQKTEVDIFDRRTDVTKTSMRYVTWWKSYHICWCTVHCTCDSNRCWQREFPSARSFSMLRTEELLLTETCWH